MKRPFAPAVVTTRSTEQRPYTKLNAFAILHFVHPHCQHVYKRRMHSQEITKFKFIRQCFIRFSVCIHATCLHERRLDVNLNTL